MNPDIHLVIKLQGLDHRISELEKEISALPKHIAQIEKALDTHNRRLEADRAAITANQKERKKQESDIQAAEQKIAKLRDQVTQSKTNEQYRAFQSEIAHFQGEIRKCEDRILDLMGQAEPLEAAVKKAEVAFKEEKTHVDAEKKKAVDRTTIDQKQLAAAQAERKQAATDVGPDILKLYERACKKTRGSGIAEAIESRCSACMISLRPQFFQQLRMGAVQSCESCGRILYYNPPVDIAAEMADRQVH